MKALIATDGTPQAREAARSAVALLHPDLEIEIIRVIPEEEDPNASATGFAGPLMTEEEAEEQYNADRAQAKTDLKATLESLGESATITVIEGSHPGRQICELAAERGAAVLVVGQSDKGWFQRLMSGSVMEYASQNSPCPVLIVRHAEA